LSPAYCFWCAYQIAPLGPAPPELAAAGEPLGTCFDCRVFGCTYHGEREQKGGKWICFPSVAAALSVAAGLDVPDEVEPTLQIEGSEDFEKRLPRLAAATEERRRMWRERAEQLDEATGDREVDPYLLADALGVGDSLVDGRGESRFFRGAAEEDEGGRPAIFTVLPERLGSLLLRLSDG
jgi:hypothetical protein